MDLEWHSRNLKPHRRDAEHAERIAVDDRAEW